jgi:hypothetical protein
METEKPVCRLTRAAVRSKYELNYLSTMRTIGPAIEWQTSEGCQREHPRLYFAESVLLCTSGSTPALSANTCDSGYRPTMKAEGNDEQPPREAVGV